MAEGRGTADQALCQRLTALLQQELASYLPGVRDDDLLRHVVAIMKAVGQAMETLVLEGQADG